MRTLARALLFSCAGAIAACGTLLGISADDEPDPGPTPIGDGGTEAASEDADAGSPSADSSNDADASDASTDTSPPACIGGPCPRWVFVTNEAWSGDAIGGTAGADSKCQKAGDVFKPGRQWRALLSDGTSTVSGRFVTSATADYVTGNGLVVAQGWSSFLSITHLERMFDDQGNLPPGDDVWTNTDTAGNAVGEDCFGWTKNMGNGVIGNASATDDKWLTNGALGCVLQAHLYCVEQ